MNIASAHWWAVCSAFASLAILFWHWKNQNIILHMLTAGRETGRVVFFSPARRFVKRGLLVVAVLSLAVAFLKPQWGTVEQVVEQHGRDVLIMLDISRSMYAQDMKPNRLECMKNKIRQLLARLSFERVGLILFSDNAFVQCPLTSDYHTFFVFLQNVTPESLSAGTTSFKAPLREAARVFSRTPARMNRLVILITDGEDFVSDHKELAALVAQEKMSLCVWGVGSEHGAPVPVVDAEGSLTGYEKDESGRPVMTRLETQFLQSLVQSVGGELVIAEYGVDDCEKISAFVERHEQETFAEERKIERAEERYPLFLGISFCVFLLEMVL